MKEIRNSADDPGSAQSDSADSWVCEELSGVRVFYENGLVTGLETPEDKVTKITYARKSAKTPIVKELSLPDGSKLVRAGKLWSDGCDHWDAKVVVHTPSMQDSLAYVRYTDKAGDKHTLTASLGDVKGDCLPSDGNLLMDLYQKNLPVLDLNHDYKLSKSELAGAMENPNIKGIDAIFLATIKHKFNTIRKFGRQIRADRSEVDQADIANICQGFAKYAPGSTGKLSLKNGKLDAIADIWLFLQNKSRFITNELYANGPDKSISPKYVRQGCCGNCYYQTEAGSLALTMPQVIEQMIKPHPEGGWTVKYPSPFQMPIHIKYVTEAEQMLYGGATGGGLWTGVFEKAFAIAKERDKLLEGRTAKKREPSETLQDYSAAGEAFEVLRRFTDRVPVEKSPSELTESELDQILSTRVKKVPIGVGVDNSKISGLDQRHSLYVLDYDAQAKKVQIGEPNGYYEPLGKKGAPLDGKRDGRFWVSLQELKEKFYRITYLDH